ncbi:putative vrR-nuclease [Caudoviricetes sp.]|nr:putative vrR-nuclease [Caudoviricetes sp.]
MKDNRYISRRRKKNPEIPYEDFEQAKFVEWFRQTFPAEKIVMIRNDGSRTAIEKNKQITMGMEAGASDLVIPKWSLWIEMKRTKKWSQSEDQKEFEKYITSIGQMYILGIGWEDTRDKVMQVISQRSNNTLWRCTICGRIGEVGRCCGDDTRLLV